MRRVVQSLAKDAGGAWGIGKLLMDPTPTVAHLDTTGGVDGSGPQAPATRSPAKGRRG